MWPMISAYAQSTIKKTVEPMVAESLREYKINNFAFDKLRLGSIVSTDYLDTRHGCKCCLFLTNIQHGKFLHSRTNCMCLA